MSPLVVVGFVVTVACFLGAAAQCAAPRHESHGSPVDALGAYGDLGNLLLAGLLILVGLVLGILSLVGAVVGPARRERAEQVRAYNEAVRVHNEAVYAHYAKLGIAPPTQLPNPDAQGGPQTGTTAARIPEAKAHFREPDERNGK